MFWRKSRKTIAVAKAEPLAPSRLPQSPFAEGALRLAALARTAGEQRLFEAAQTGKAEAVFRSSVITPDERWTRQFMTQGIGPQPQREVDAFPEMPSMGQVFLLKNLEQPPQVETRIQPDISVPQPMAEERPGPMAAQIGRGPDKPRRSRIGRWLRGA